MEAKWRFEQCFDYLRSTYLNISKSQSLDYVNTTMIYLHAHTYIVQHDITHYTRVRLVTLCHHLKRTYETFSSVMLIRKRLDNRRDGTNNLRAR